MNTSRTLSWVTAILGIWTGISPFIFNFSNVASALWDFVIVGIVLLVLGIIAAVTTNLGTKRGLDWLNAIVGLWLLISPFVLGFSSFVGSAQTDAIIVGIVVIILNVWAALSIRTVGTAGV